MFDVFCCSSWTFISSLKIGTVQPYCIRRMSCRHWNKCNWCRATWLILRKTRSSGLQTINAPLSSLLRDLKPISLMPQLLTAFLPKKTTSGRRKIKFPYTVCCPQRHRQTPLITLFKPPWLVVGSSSDFNNNNNSSSNNDFASCCIIFLKIEMNKKLPFSCSVQFWMVGSVGSYLSDLPHQTLLIQDSLNQLH